MKLKKSIISILIIEILINNFFITSNAGVLSPDTRYETFEGNSLKIEKIIDEDNIDIEIKGNTVVNLLGEQGESIFLHNNNSSYPKRRTFTNFNLKTNTTYSLIVNIGNLSSAETSRLKVSYEHVDENGKTVIIYPKGHASKELIREGRMTIIFATDERKPEPGLELYIDTQGSLSSGGIATQFSFESYECMLLEGDWSNIKLPDYYEGMQSVVESNNEIEIKSNNINIFNGVMEIGSIDLTGDGSNIDNIDSKVYRSNYIDVSPNTIYTLSQRRSVCFYDGDKKRISNTYSNIITTPPNCFYIRFQQYGNEIITIAEGNIPTNNQYLNDIKRIKLNQPLRGLPTGISDKIIKKNGQWMIERKVGEIVLDGSENWAPQKTHGDGNTMVFMVDLKQELNNRKAGSYNFIFDKFTSYESYPLQTTIDVEGASMNYADIYNTYVYIRILKSKLESENTSGIKKWLNNNPVTAVYELVDPVYEPLNIGPSIDIFEETTYITNNSVIPANMNTVVDRILNRVIESSEKAKLNPTISNLSIARMWINQMDDSIIKDNYQEEINNINNIKDMVLERKSITSNLDLYIKSENILIMSISTNSITFDDFSGIEDVENNLNINISSSLPYNLNSYLTSEIFNSDKSKTLDKSVLNLKENSESEYKNFTDINDKLILKENNNLGNDIIHKIDLKLKGGIAHDKDIYKTTIKFEAVQQ